MSVDARIVSYLKAAREMAEGRFAVQVPVGEDDVGRLGHALRRLGDSLESRFQELQTLTAVTERVNAGLLLDDVLDSVYESFRTILPYDRIGFSLLEEDPKLGTVVKARWARSEAPVKKIDRNFALPLEKTSLGRILETGTPRILDDLEDYYRGRPESLATRLIVEEGMRSSLTCPLVAKGRPIGFMFFSSMKTGAYADVHVEVFRQVAGQLSVIVEKGRMYQQLVDLNALKDRFLGIAAHDLRNPIGVTRGYVQLLLGGALGEVPPAQRKVLEKVLDSCGTMLTLVEDLLDFSALESGQLELHREPLDPGPYLQEFASTFRLLARPKEITVETDLPEHLPQVPADSGRLDQVLHNLLGNAVKFSPRGSVVTLRARAEGSGVRVEVQDRGQGIPEDEQEGLFQAFRRASSRPTGGEKSTGLGLAITRRIVEAHGGVVGLASREGEGSTFFFTLPG